MRISLTTPRTHEWLLVPFVLAWVLGVSFALAHFEAVEVAGWVVFAAFAILVLARPVLGMAALLGLVSAKHLLTAWLPGLERPFLPIALLVLAAAFFDKLRRDRLVLVFGKGYLCLCVFAVFALASSTQAVSEPWYRDYLWRLLIGLTLFSLFAHQNDDARTFRWLVLSVIGWTTANALAGCMTWLVGGAGFRFGRLTGWMGDPNDFAIGLAIAVPLVVSQWRRARTLPSRLVLSIALVAIFASILFSESRGGLVFLGLALLWSARRELQWSYLRTALLGLAFAGLVIAFLPDSFRERIDSLRDSWEGRDRGHATSVVRRVALLHAGVEMTVDRPFTGVGLGNFRVVASRYEPSVPYLLPAHNMYVEVAAELGVVAFLAFLAWLMLVFASVRSARDSLARMDEEYRTLYRGLFALVVLYLLSGILRNCEYDAALWAMLGLLVAGAHIARSTDEADARLAQSPN